MTTKRKIGPDPLLREQQDKGADKPIAHNAACTGCDDCRYVPPPKRQEVATATRLASKVARSEVDTFIRENQRR